MKSILVIDDSMIQCRMMNVLLQDKYDLTTTTSGIEGIRLAKEKRPDLILLDYDMPVLSGKETLKKLKEQDETKDIPVIFLTGVDGREAVEDVLKFQPQGYILKPAEKDRLLKTIRKVLSDNNSN